MKEMVIILIKSLLIINMAVTIFRKIIHNHNRIVIKNGKKKEKKDNLQEQDKQEEQDINKYLKGLVQSKSYCRRMTNVRK